MNTSYQFPRGIAIHLESWSYVWVRDGSSQSSNAMLLSESSRSILVIAHYARNQISRRKQAPAMWS